MAKKRQSSIIKSKSNLKIYLFIIAVSIALVAAGGAFAVFATGQELSRIGENSGVGVMVSVSGNDFIVKIVNEGRADELIGIKITISGVSLSDEYAYSDVERGSSEVVFKGVAYGIFGEKDVAVKGYFSDETTSALLVSSVYFG